MLRVWHSALPRIFVSASHLSSMAGAQLYQESTEPDVLLRRLEIEVRGHDNAVLSSYDKFVRQVCDELNLNLVKV